jgi:hypothetical protein
LGSIAVGTTFSTALTMSAHYLLREAVKTRPTGFRSSSNPIPALPGVLDAGPNSDVEVQPRRFAVRERAHTRTLCAGRPSPSGLRTRLRGIRVGQRAVTNYDARGTSGLETKSEALRAFTHREFMRNRPLAGRTGIMGA